MGNSRDCLESLKLRSLYIVKLLKDVKLLSCFEFGLKMLSSWLKFIFE